MKINNQHHHHRNSLASNEYYQHQHHIFLPPLRLKSNEILLKTHYGIKFSSPTSFLSLKGSKTPKPNTKFLLAGKNKGKSGEKGNKR